MTLAPEHLHTIADLLGRDAAQLGARWQTQVRSYAPRMPSQQALADAAEAERIVRAVASALRGSPAAQDEVIRVGWALGSASHVVGMSLHYLLKEIDLLTSILLYACERALADDMAGAAAGSTGGPAAGLALARRLHRTLSLLTLAAAKGFTQAYVADLQGAYRVLRHDLRNPIGTIKGAVSLMEDESVAPEMRNDPRFRAMVVRNAKSLDTVIGEQLSDAATLVPAFARQEVSLREVALAVRRDLREEARERDCEIAVDPALPTVLTDATAFELALKSVVNWTLLGAPPGTTVTVGLGALCERSAVVTVGCAADVVDTADLADAADLASACATAEALAFARELAARGGGRVWLDGPVASLEVPVSAPHARNDVARPG